MSPDLYAGGPRQGTKSSPQAIHFQVGTQGDAPLARPLNSESCLPLFGGRHACSKVSECISACMDMPPHTLTRSEHFPTG